MEMMLQNNFLKVLGVTIGVILGLLFFLYPTITVVKVVLGITFLFLVFIRPESGIYLVAFLIPFVPLRYIALLLIVVSLSFIINLILNEDRKLKKIPFGYSIILFLIPIVFSTLSSYTPKISLNHLIAYIIAILILFLGINLIDTKKKLYYLLIILIISSLLVSLYGVYQYKAGVKIQESWVDKELNPDLKTRVYSTLDNPNILAEYLILLIPITLSIMWVSKYKSKKLIFLIFLGIQLLCLVLTYSRGGWVGFALTMIIFAIFVDRRLFIIYIIMGLSILLISPEVILTRIMTIGNVEDTSTAYRFPIWKATIDMIRDFWITGVGLGSTAFKTVYPKYMRQGIIAAHSHNIYLQMFIETGIFGFIGFISLIYTTIKSNLISFTKGYDNKSKVISIGVLSGLLGILLHGIAEHIFFSEKIVLTFWILVTVSLINYRLEFEKNLDEQV